MLIFPFVSNNILLLGKNKFWGHSMKPSQNMSRFHHHSSRSNITTFGITGQVPLNITITLVLIKEVQIVVTSLPKHELDKYD